MCVRVANSTSYRPIVYEKYPCKMSVSQTINAYGELDIIEDIQIPYGIYSPWDLQCTINAIKQVSGSPWHQLLPMMHCRG